MKPREKSASLQLTAIRPLGLGLCVGMVCCTLLLLLVALLLSTVDIPHSAVTPLAITVAGISAFLAGLTTALATRRHGLLWGAVCGALLYLILLVAGLIRSGDVNGAYALVKFGVFTLCGAIGGLVVAARR